LINKNNIWALGLTENECDIALKRSAGFMLTLPLDLCSNSVSRLTIFVSVLPLKTATVEPGFSATQAKYRMNGL
jgi:hypothetical protein